MRIIEHSIIEKQSDDTCEDGIVTTVNHIAVIDGSTSKTPERVNPKMRNGRFAMQLVSDVVSSLPSQTTMLQFCRIVTDAIDEAYKASVMKHKYPVCVLSIYIPAGGVDVNVHPQKAEVKFSDDSIIFRLVLHGIRNAVFAQESVVPSAPRVEKVVAESKARSLEDYPVSDELHKVLNARRPVILDETKKIDFNGIESNSQIICPIISDSELVGGVILFPKSVGNEKVMLKLCECAAKFIGSQV